MLWLIAQSEQGKQYLKQSASANVSAEEFYGANRFGCALISVIDKIAVPAAFN
jgi:hypothetical protein